MLKMDREFYKLCQPNIEFYKTLDSVCENGLNLVVKDSICDEHIWHIHLENGQYHSDEIGVSYYAEQYRDLITLYNRHDWLTEDEERRMEYTIGCYFDMLRRIKSDGVFVDKVIDIINNMIEEYKSYKINGRDIILTNNE